MTNEEINKKDKFEKPNKKFLQKEYISAKATNNKNYILVIKRNETHYKNNLDGDVLTTASL